MARHETVALKADEFTQITNGAATVVTFQNVGGIYFDLVGTVTADSPAGSAYMALRYRPGHGVVNLTLAGLFPGLVGVVRLWALAPDAGLVAISHD